MNNENPNNSDVTYKLDKETKRVKAEKWEGVRWEDALAWSEEYSEGVVAEVHFGSPAFSVNHKGETINRFFESRVLYDGVVNKRQSIVSMCVYFSDYESAVEYAATNARVMVRAIQKDHWLTVLFDIDASQGEFVTLSSPGGFLNHAGNVRFFTNGLIPEGYGHPHTEDEFIVKSALVLADPNRLPTLELTLGV